MGPRKIIAIFGKKDLCTPGTYGTLALWLGNNNLDTGEQHNGNVN